MRQKKIEIPIYGAELIIILDKDLKYVSEKYKTGSLEDFGAVTLKDESKFKSYIVAFEYFTGSIIAHEIVHIINYLYLDIGIHLDRENDEHQAYLTGWLFNEINEFINKE